MEIKVKRSKTDKNPVVVEFDFGNTLTEAQEKFDGESVLDKVVYGLFLHAAKQQLSDYVRKLLEPVEVLDKDDAPTGRTRTRNKTEIQKLVDEWKPTVEKAAKRAVEKAKSVIDGLSDSQRAALMAQLGGNTPSLGPQFTSEVED